MNDEQTKLERALVRLVNDDIEGQAILTKAGLVGPIQKWERALDEFEKKQSKRGLGRHLTPESEYPLDAQQQEELYAARDFRSELFEIVGQFVIAEENEREAHQRVRGKRLVDAFHQQVSGIRIDGAYDKDQLAELARRYVDAPELRAPSFTRFILATLIDTELYPLRREVEDPTSVIASHTAKISPLAAAQLQMGRFGNAVSWGVILLFAIAAGYLWERVPWIAYGLTAVALYSAASQLWNNRKLKQAKNQVRMLLHGTASRLELVRDEIARGSFNSEVLSERLRHIEKDGGYVPSIIYTLLSLR